MRTKRKSEVHEIRKSMLVQYNSKYKDIMHGLILEDMEKNESCSVLDIGCRWGHDIQKIAGANEHVHIAGIDISLDALKGAKTLLQKNQNVSLFQARFEGLPFKDNSFDIIISSEVIEHIENADDVLRDIYHILKKDGIFIVTTPSRFNYITLIGKAVPLKFKKFLRRLVYYLPQGNEDINPHEYEYTPGELTGLFEKNGFRVERISGGVLRVPVWPLFERLSFLLFIWKCLDRFIEMVPWGINLKHNFVLAARK